jgi:hypothetical protein
MNFRVIFAACTIATLGLPMITSNFFGQQPSLNEHLPGTWTLLAWEQKRADGTKIEPYGENPTGIAF